MAANKSVTVLTPNGRRPNIKITPNTTILQILEEACKKYDFNPDEYDLKHYNRILDVNLIFRYANISNNASLEMVKCVNPRKVSNVTICVQLEDGNRLAGEFSPNTKLEKILNDLNIEYNLETSVVIYMQREIYSKEFESVTLRALGLGSGKALFRLLHRNPEKLKEQAHVYLPPKPKVCKTEEYEEDKPRSAPIMDNKKNKISDPVHIVKMEKEKLQKADTKNKNSEIEKKNEDDIEEVCDKNLSQIKEISNATPMDVDENNKEETREIIQKQVEEEPQVEFLGERNALIFNQAGAKAMHQDDIPDNFFELTVNDAKALLRDVKKTRAKLEDSPLITSAQRELEKDKETLNRLHKYQQTVIRIQFPNQLVLQGLFSPLETIQTVKDFIKNYLENSEADFTLYTSPPRCDLIATERLFDCDLVPSAIIYYSGNSDLKPEIKSKLTDPTAASFQAVKTRLTTIRKDNAPIDSDEPIDSCSSTSALKSIPSLSRHADTNNSIVESQAGPSKSQVPKTQLPKWFKLSTK